MQRTALTDNSGMWFDIEKAEKFNEKLIWDGDNQISKVTGSQWAHEIIYRTSGGKWILSCWSELQVSRETYEMISNQDAAAWFIINEYSDYKIGGASALLQRHIDALEL